MATWIFAGLFLVVLVMLIRAFGQITSLREDLRRVKQQSTPDNSRQLEEVISKLALHDMLLKRIANDDPITGAMVEDGQLWSDINASEVQGFLQENPKTLIVDVRTNVEYESGHIPGAVIRPIDQFHGLYQDLPKDRPLMMVCMGGGRSAAACEILTSNGYTQVYDVADGMGYWQGDMERGPDSSSS